MVRVQHTPWTVYAEGGARGAGAADLRRGFKALFDKLGLKHNPKVVACGSRQQAYERFKLALEQGDSALLLVDSEAPVHPDAMPGDDLTDWEPWIHLRQQDNWKRPPTATQRQAHLMVQCMESWLLCDPQALAQWFGAGYVQPPVHAPGVEALSAHDAFQRLRDATRHCGRQKQYDKGWHSFEALARVRPEHIEARSLWAKRFFDVVRKGVA
jgi:hypothetical protein